MAFGFSPKYVQILPIDPLTPQEFLVLAIEAAKILDWNIAFETETGFIAYTKFSMTSWSEEVKVTIEGDQATLKSECTGNQLMDWGKNKGNIESLVAELELLKSTVTPEDMARQFEELKPTFAANEEDNHLPPATKGKFTGILSLFWPSKGYFITPIIVDLNILIYILMVISGVDFMSPNTKDLLNWGANFRPSTLNGEWWRLLTNVFLHIGLLHLLFNMYALVYIGLLLEPYLGKLRFLAAYILTGIVASTTSLYMHDATVSAGASGAIFGMYGVFLAMLTTNFIEKSARKAMLTSILVFVAYNLMNGMKGGIDNAAHVGGLLSGFIIGYLYYPSLKAPDRMDLKLGIISAVLIVVLLACFTVGRRIPNNLGQYDEKMKNFASMESMALEVYQMPKNTPKDTLLKEIKDRGLYYWNQDIELINSIDKLDLPDALHKRDKILVNYCNLRIKSYNLIYKAINENSNSYKDSIEFYNKDIGELIDSLKGK
ncbi:rhomboid family intramembrane serine protease [Mucilaginibacter gotjawali]|uniref:Rhomboid protease GluP n=2 Tax=Mucilaginibacter gotjawali TaxID=1550579 RepID=A0A839SDA1_9SPHI|nr:rhomboid family intramembrane serine protease [Mucilaginibacter gotjawali]MBB3056215.1 rhomboid protease GluP [Mucilaginibacter gotjawali]BAU53443.1 Rhomboid protease GluP [Mucilaginibacter gotjawali]